MTDSSSTTSIAQPRALPTELISPSELARRLNCTRQNVYLLARKEWFPQSYRYGPRLQRWDWPQVVAALEANRPQLDERARSVRAENLHAARDALARKDQSATTGLVA